MRIIELLPPNPILCTADTPLQEVAQTMIQNNLFYIPVVESLIHKNPIGVVTERSICRRSIAEGLNPLRLTAGRVMNSIYKIVTPNTSLENCYRIMGSDNVRYLVIVDDGNVCRGIAIYEEIYKKINKPEIFSPLHKIASFPGQISKVDRIF